MAKTKDKRPLLNPAERKLLVDMASSGQSIVGRASKTGHVGYTVGKRSISPALLQSACAKGLICSTVALCYWLTELGHNVADRAIASEAKRAAKERA